MAFFVGGLDVFRRCLILIAAVKATFPRLNPASSDSLFCERHRATRIIGAHAAVVGSRFLLAAGADESALWGEMAGFFVGGGVRCSYGWSGNRFLRRMLY